MIVDALGPEGFGTYEVDWTGPTFARVSKPAAYLAVPGFVDLHIHGGFGVDFMSADADDMRHLCERLQGEGYEAFLPTTITAAASDVKRALAALPESDMILGFHLEGPFISPEFPGAQPPEAIAEVPTGDSEWDEVLEDPRLRVVTLAPELPHASGLITRLMRRGVRVSMGHSNATYDEARQGFEFGASHTTHTFNAMRPLHHREAGLVGYALLNDALRTELIYDRHHVSKEAAAVLLRCKPEDGVVAVSDGTRAIGVPPGQTIDMWGHRCIVGRGQVRLADGGALAGSAVTLLDVFRNLFEDFGPETAIRACCLNPRLAIGLSGPPRVYLLLDREFRVVERRVVA
jgi:N-acetylglucosamine-6-phosphate deacetylase